MIKLSAIVLRNWMTVADQTVRFPSHGLVVVNGRNAANAEKFSSVGSGKTCLGEAISRALIGLEGRYAQISHYSRQDKGNMYVGLECRHGSDPLRIELGYKCPELSRSGPGLRFKIGNGDTIERARVADTRAELDLAIRNTRDLSRWTVHVDGGWLQFGDLSQRNSMELILQALGQPSWDEIHDLVRDKLGKATAASARVELGLDRVKTELDRARADVASLETRYEQERVRVAQDEARRDALCSEAKIRLSRVESELVRADTKLNSVIEAMKTEFRAQEQAKAEFMQKAGKSSAQIEDETKALNAIRDCIRDARTDLTVANKEIEQGARMRARPSSPAEIVCVTLPKLRAAASGIQRQAASSGLELDMSELKAAIDTVASAADGLDPDSKGAEKAKDRALDELDKLKAACTKREAVIEALRSERDALFSAERRNAGLDTFHSKLDKAKAEQESAKAEVKSAQDRVAKLAQPVKDESEALLAVLVDRKNGMSKMEAELAQFKIEREATSAQAALVRYWELACGPSGIPNMIVERSVESLNAVSRQVSQTMTGGSITVTYSTETERVNGSVKPRLDINVVNQYGSGRVQGNSKGETGLTNLIIAETLAEVGRVSTNIGYRWYDEITNGQDSQVRASIFAYLKDLAARKQILVFLVDHSPEAANYADHVLTAVKTGNDGGTTEFVWA